MSLAPIRARFVTLQARLIAPERIDRLLIAQRKGFYLLRTFQSGLKCCVLTHVCRAKPCRSCVRHIWGDVNSIKIAEFSCVGGYVSFHSIL